MTNENRSIQLQSLTKLWSYMVDHDQHGLVRVEVDHKSEVTSPRLVTTELVGHPYHKL